MFCYEVHINKVNYKPTHDIASYNNCLILNLIFSRCQNKVYTSLITTSQLNEISLISVKAPPENYTGLHKTDRQIIKSQIKQNVMWSNG